MGGSNGGRGGRDSGKAGSGAGNTTASGGDSGETGESGREGGGTGGTGTGGTGTGGSGNAGGGGTGNTGKGTPGGPTSCGEDFAFCDTFDEPTDSPGPRTVDLDPARWSVGRISPQLASYGDCSICVLPASVSNCRSGVGSQVFPDEDTLICDANDGIDSRHLLTAVGSQNYGLNTYRIRQPFDFTGRTGKIVFDVEGFAPDPLLGWASLEVSEDPTPTPSYPNYEYATMPRRSVSFQIAVCESTSNIGARELRVSDDFAMDMPEPSFSAEGDDCVSTADDQLNHYEVLLSRTSIEVFATDVSDDGVSFGTPRRVLAADLDLPFERGYVSITTRNHASNKYSDGAYDAWVVRWDNVGFDGDVFANTREYSAPDSLTNAEGGDMKNVGYPVPDNEGDALSFTLEDVDTADVQRAVLAFTTYYPLCCESSDYSTYNMRHRVNGGEWHDRFLTAGEQAALGEDDQTGAFNHLIELDPGELQAGSNTFEFATAGVDQGYPAVIANLDLILTTN
jgi:hypothetical protein